MQAAAAAVDKARRRSARKEGERKVDASEAKVVCLFGVEIALDGDALEGQHETESTARQHLGIDVTSGDRRSAAAVAAWVIERRILLVGLVFVMSPQ